MKSIIVLYSHVYCSDVNLRQKTFVVMMLRLEQSTHLSKAFTAEKGTHVRNSRADVVTNTSVPLFMSYFKSICVCTSSV